MSERRLTLEQVRKIEEIYHAAMECQADNREDFVAAACGNDEALAQEIHSLLSTRGSLPDLAKVASLQNTSTAQLFPGTMLGPYQIQTQLGSGGMGEVYKAADTRLHRTVAIKVLHAESAWNPELRKRFEREAKTLSSFNHPHICTLYDIGREDDTDYLVMEYVQGETLLGRIPAGGMPLPEVLAIARSIASALAAAHAAEIIHRDLKPSNIMIRRDGVVKVLDFGLAKTSPNLPGRNENTQTLQQTRVGAIVGTAAYMSPEQAEGKSVDSRSDVFSFGALLYEMLTGTRAFRGETLIAAVSAVLKDTPPPVRSARRDVSPAVQAIVDQCLSKDREQRYASGAELEAALVRVELRPKRNTSFRRKVAASAVTMLLASTAGWFAWKQRRMNWVYQQAIPDIYRLQAAQQYLGCFQLAMKAKRIAPGDPSVQKAVDACCIKAAFQSEPPGANMFYRPYADPSAPEELLVRTNGSAEIPIDILRLRIVKDGYEEAEGTVEPGSNPLFLLDRKGTRPEGMVNVTGGPQTWEGGSLELPGYWLDKYEVSNTSYKHFVDAGGYRNRAYWKYPFRANGRELSWEEAMRTFVDGTGKPGPANWELGDFPEGKKDFPVGGVSWYEAAAFAEYSGKQLPSVAHWQHAAGFGQFAEILKFSNFEGKGPGPTGKFRGVGPFGTYDMAGNVEEWCFNSFGENRAILGGSSDEASYRFRYFHANGPMERLPKYGFRCAKYRVPPPEKAFVSLRQPERNPYQEIPASDQTFQTWKMSYAYDHAPLAAKIESSDDTSAHYREEMISFGAPYGDERMQARLFLPKNSSPPFQTVIYFPPGGANFIRSSMGQGPQRQIEFLMRSGRALMLPIFLGTFERMRPLSPGPNAYRTRVIQHAQELQRSIDYLETRQETIDVKKLAFYGFSTGCHEGVLAVAMEPRIRTAIMAYCGIPTTRQPEGIDAVDLVSRIRIPVLMLDGRDEFFFPYATSTLPMLNLLGTPSNDKKLVLREGGHILAFPPETFREILGWLDRYLGPVK